MIDLPPNDSRYEGIQNMLYVLTYCTEKSYGSVLQAYALKTVLKKLGYESKILIQDKPPKASYTLSVSRPRTIRGNVKYLVRRLSYRKRNQRYEGTQRFINKHLDVIYCDCIAGKMFSDNDVFLAGSDQVWNPLAMKPEFFLEFAPQYAPKLTYAVSMGVSYVPEDKQVLFRDMIQKFKCISVREKEMLTLLKEYTDADLDAHIDPTFLLTAEQWRHLEEPYPVKKPYILVFPLFWDPSYNEQLRQLHKATGKDIIVVDEYLRHVYGNKRLYDVNLNQFLWLIDHADGVVTSSFHGVAFSMIFHKKTAAVINPQSTSRITSLFELLGYRNQKIITLSRDDSQDFLKIDQRIQAEKQRSVAYLREALKN